MKKIISLLLAVFLLAGTAASLAEGGAEGVEDMPIAGMCFTEPEEFADTKGLILTDGAIQFYGSMYYAYWTYFAMTEEELDEARNDADKAAEAQYYDLFYLLSIGEGQTFDDFNSLINNGFDPQYALEVGKAGDTTVYLYMEPADQKFADSIAPEYRDEYLRLAALGESVAAGIECYEPYDPLIGSKVEFTTTDLDGNEISSADLFAQNEITMINIWATWCGYCINEFPELQQIHLELQEKGCGIVGMLDDEDKNLELAKQQIAEGGLEYLNIRVPENVQDILPIEAYPTTYFISRDGVILASAVVGAYVDEYRKTLDALLAPQE